MRDIVTTGMKIMVTMGAEVHKATKIMAGDMVKVNMVEAATDVVTVVINKNKLKKASLVEKPFLVYIYLFLTIDL
jgi:hypothetical protein